MDKDYWVKFWNDYTASSNDKDSHTQVLRTLNRMPISEALWEFTLSEIDKNFTVQNNDKVLDLCAGNGLISRHFVSKGATVTAVDVSKDLLSNLKDVDQIQTINSDIRDLKFDKNSFDKVIVYAGIQYLNLTEAIELLQNIYLWLKPGGIVFIGDIPDLSRLWEFYNTKERQELYYENIINGTAIVGQWFDKIWLENLTHFLGFEKSNYLAQDERLIYSKFRFDFLYKKAND
jgi:2-polyprenyl-3-methyl-5-hydroxy-6-metoxy-1,4-benzoquinol methylase